MTAGPSRVRGARILLGTMYLSTLAAAQDVLPAEKAVQLQGVPAAVYKVDDPGHGETESWTFNVVALCKPNDCSSKPVAATIELFSSNTVVDKTEIGATELEKAALTSYRVLPETPAASSRRGFLLHEAFDLTFTRPKKLNIDRTRVRLNVANFEGKREEAVLDIPIAVYRQKTALIFPFRGPGLVMQGWINDGGHSGYANQLAIDVLGLDANYAPQTNDKDENSSYAGWDREIMAPADGTVVYARNDVLNNPAAGDPAQKLLDSQHDPMLAVAGNCVIIDHGNSEFSVMMHMRQGSVRVKAGDLVKQGQVVGHLGNSGDSFGPHLHYQLQAGPELFRDQSIPFTFQNVNRTHLFRGTYFRAK
jgi:peptidase M23-like protein